MNYNNSILLIDPAFNPSMASACNLLIKIGVDSFSYAILNKTTKQVVALYDEQECSNNLLDLTERFDKDSNLNLPYQETKVTVYTDDEISIPNEFFDENSIELHSKLLKKNVSKNIFKQNHFNFTTIFGLHKSLQNMLTTQLNNLKIYPQFAGILTFAEDAKETQLFLNFSAKSFSCLFIKDDKVIFQKSYEVENLEEFNYFMLLIINQLKINTKEIEIQLSGIIHNEDDKFKCLQKYFSQINFSSIDDDINARILEDLPTHYYTNLLALDQCV